MIVAILKLTSAKMCGEGCGPMHDDELCARNLADLTLYQFSSTCQFDMVNCESTIMGGPICKIILKSI